MRTCLPSLKNKIEKYLYRVRVVYKSTKLCDQDVTPAMLGKQVDILQLESKTYIQT